MSASNIERVALDWMAARMVREHVVRLRNEQRCVHEPADLGSQPPEGSDGVPCWKGGYENVAPDGATEWQPHRSPMCAACEKRWELHQRIAGLRRREASLHGALTRICRARVLAGSEQAVPA